jgi:hypothetical protein
MVAMIYKIACILDIIIATPFVAVFGAIYSVAEFSTRLWKDFT